MHRQLWSRLAGYTPYLLTMSLLNMFIGTAVSRMHRVCVLAIQDPGDSDILTAVVNWAAESATCVSHKHLSLMFWQFKIGRRWTVCSTRCPLFHIRLDTLVRLLTISTKTFAPYSKLIYIFQFSININFCSLRYYLLCLHWISFKHSNNLI